MSGDHGLRVLVVIMGIGYDCTNDTNGLMEFFFIIIQYALPSTKYLYVYSEVNLFKFELIIKMYICPNDQLFHNLFMPLALSIFFVQGSLFQTIYSNVIWFILYCINNCGLYQITNT